MSATELSVQNIVVRIRDVIITGLWQMLTAPQTSRDRGGFKKETNMAGKKQGRRQRGGSRGSRPFLSLIERFSKDETTPLTTPKRGKNDVEMP